MFSEESYCTSRHDRWGRIRDLFRWLVESLNDTSEPEEYWGVQHLLARYERRRSGLFLFSFRFRNSHRPSLRFHVFPHLISKNPGDTSLPLYCRRRRRRRDSLFLGWASWLCLGRKLARPTFVPESNKLQRDTGSVLSITVETYPLGFRRCSRRLCL